jgi:hypothetical protein
MKKLARAKAASSIIEMLNKTGVNSTKKREMIEIIKINTPAL